MWMLHPDTVSLLQRGEGTVRLSPSQREALEQCLQGAAPVTSLPPELFRQLFEAGILTPTIAAIGPERWRSRLTDLALAPSLRLSLEFRDGPIRLEGMEPSIGLALDPDVVQVAAQLSALYRDALKGAVQDSAVRDLAFPRAQADRLIQDVAARWLEQHAGSRPWLDWRRDGQGLQLRIAHPETLTRDVPSFPDCSIGAALNGRMRSVEIPTSSLPGIAAVLDVLRGGPIETLAAAALALPAGAAVLQMLEDLGGLIPASEAPPVLQPEGDPGISLTATHLGHAHVLVDSERHRILVDAQLYPWDDRFERQPPTSRQLGRVDALFFTHHHEDHLDTDSLLTLPHDIPVYVPPDPEGPLRPRLIPFLRALGFRDVRTLVPGQVVAFDDGLQVEAVPFYGESSATLGWNATCYLVSRRGRNILLHADASPDLQGRSLLSTGELKKLVGRVGPIEAIFGSWWQERLFAGQLSSQALLLLPPSRWLDVAESCDCPPEYLRDLVRVCGAGEFLLYAENGEELYLPEPARSDYSRITSFLWRSRDEVVARLTKETGARVTQVLPYQRLSVPLAREHPVRLSR